MLFRAKNGTLKINGGGMDYIRFGKGKRNLVILPGLGDGLQTVKGTAVPMALMYRAFAKEFTVYAFSRKHPLPAGYTTRDMGLKRNLPACAEIATQRLTRWCLSFLSLPLICLFTSGAEAFS